MDLNELKKIRSFAIERAKTHFRIRYRAIDGKLHRLSPDKHPVFTNKVEAQEWIKTKQAFLAGEKSRVAKIRANNQRYPQVQEKLKLYCDHKNEGKLKDLKTIEAYFQNYIFNFFLSQKQSNNLNEWSLFYPEFLRHLRTTKSKKGTPLALETQRKICFYFNDFLEFLFKHKHTVSYIEKLEVPDAEDSELSLEEAYWTEEEIERVIPFLSEDTRNLFIFGLETGMRISEMLGVTRQLYYKGDLPRKEIHENLVKNGIIYNGYLKLESQLDTNKDGVFTLKPLKGKDKILNKWARYIPVSPRCFEIIKHYNNKIVGMGSLQDRDSNNLFWKDLTKARVNIEIQTACKQGGVFVKTTHSTRHTFCTNFLLKTSSEFLTKIISGHSSDKAFKRYLHLIESLSDSKNRTNGLL
jgi:integrase